jgi:hypothetical protein
VEPTAAATVASSTLGAHCSLPSSDTLAQIAALAAASKAAAGAAPFSTELAGKRSSLGVVYETTLSFANKFRD